MNIQILPESVASAIAAGEVVERPASVVKELVENALDAGAHSVEIVVEQAGLHLIQVVDDGQGVPAEELPLALVRHATSKLRTSDDLTAIRTLGFRGEALASIAAVSRIEIVSRTSESDAGRRVTAAGGTASKTEAVGAPKGTAVRVRDLFYNVPARLKFLKSEATERRHISDWVGRYALAYPDVRFSLDQEGRSTLATSGQGRARDVLADLLGPAVARDMIALPQTDQGAYRVRGFVSPPAVDRSNRRELTFFVNGRWVQDSSLAAAVLQAYHGLLMVGRYPMAVIFLDVSPDLVDVNVHPAKAEVRFQDPRSVFALLQRAVRATLLNQAPAPPIDWERSWGGAGWQTPETPDSPGTGGGSAPWQEFPGLTPAPRGDTGVPLLRSVGQVGTAYLVAEGPDGLYLIDQHAAHERVLFERMMDDFRRGQLESQALLTPVLIELNAGEVDLLSAELENLTSLGFALEPFGGSSFRIAAVPSLLTGVDPEFAVRAVVEDIEEDETPLEGKLEERLAARVCKRAAVKAGQTLSLAEQAQLIRDLEACASPRTCPHGRPTMIHLSVDMLEKQFGRRG